MTCSRPDLGGDVRARWAWRGLAGNEAKEAVEATATEPAATGVTAGAGVRKCGGRGEGGEGGWVDGRLG